MNEKASGTIEQLSCCRLCPRDCGTDRLREKGFCAVSGEGVHVSRAALHFWEEPCISGTRGSGTVFFSGCSLHCIYCQNREISRGEAGKEISARVLSDIFLSLQKKGAHNINLVTPTHYTCQIRDAILMAREDGLSVPVVYNGSGYESVSSLRMLEGLVDIYLTDFKYLDSKLSKELSGAADYPERAKEALEEMVRQQPECIFFEDGMMKRGVIVRHLLLPGHVKGAEAVVSCVYEMYGDRVFLSLMNQYTPIRHFEQYAFLNRRVTRREYERLIRHVLDLGVTNAFIQEGKTAEESFIPPFDLEGVEEG